MKSMLLTFTGFHDPYSKGLVGQEDQPGPILSLLSARPFNVVVLFSTPSTEKITTETKAEVTRLMPGTEVEIRDIPLNDPTDYVAILRNLRQHIREILELHQDVQYSVAVASGTPQMHACWVLLVASGEIPAKILHVRPTRFVTKDQPLVSEIDLSARDFPTVRAHVATAVAPEITPDIDIAVRQLGIVGDHPAMRAVLEMVAALAPSDASMLVCGETGTGKELLARLIHRLSGRPTELFVPINCAAIPEDLVESILFGHKKGAFTGAVSDQKGKFDLADEGTLFLDEIGELPIPTQTKLLRVLEDGMVEPKRDVAK